MEVGLVDARSAPPFMLAERFRADWPTILRNYRHSAE